MGYIYRMCSQSRFIFPATIAIAAIALANCSSQNDNGGYACAIGGIVYDNVVQPAPGAMDVPTAAGTLILQETLPVAADVSLVPAAGGTSIPLGVLPTAAPGATASPGPVPVATFAYPQLQSATTYQVAYRAVSRAMCPPELYGNGTFTTQ